MMESCFVSRRGMKFTQRRGCGCCDCGLFLATDVIQINYKFTALYRKQQTTCLVDCLWVAAFRGGTFWSLLVRIGRHALTHTHTFTSYTNTSYPNTRTHTLSFSLMYPHVRAKHTRTRLQDGCLRWTTYSMYVWIYAGGHGGKVKYIIQWAMGKLQLGRQTPRNAFLVDGVRRRSLDLSLSRGDSIRCVWQM